MLKNSASIRGLRCCNLAIFGIIPFSKTKIVLIKPAIPEAPSRCPILAFNAPLEFENQLL